ncbi:MAG: GNAT family N-acetyltransferase [Burkholderiaceae bacterium]|jgi:GNAT superfamily N-acetyltransferase|nr:GNAT family N-acetyltransferase [Burkholderiaceae bacterium]
MNFRIAAARPQDAGIVVDLVRQLAEYETLSHLVVATEDQVRDELFGPRPVIECVLGWEGDSAGAQAVGFALYFHNFSTFLARRGIYLEDLFVVPAARGRGYGKALLRHVARLALERECGRFEWSVLDWNQPAIDFYRAMGAQVLPDWRICRVTGDALARLGADA